MWICSHFAVLLARRKLLPRVTTGTRLSGSRLLGSSEWKFKLMLLKGDPLGEGPGQPSSTELPSRSISSSDMGSSSGSTSTKAWCWRSCAEPE